MHGYPILSFRPKVYMYIIHKNYCRSNCPGDLRDPLTPDRRPLPLDRPTYTKTQAEMCTSIRILVPSRRRVAVGRLRGRCRRRRGGQHRLQRLHPRPQRGDLARLAKTETCEHGDDDTWGRSMGGRCGSGREAVER